MSHYPIRTISELTGVPTTTLRAWERRHGLLKPSRTPKGHRLYSSQDVDLINEIVKLLKANHTISEAIRIVNNPELRTTVSSYSDGHWQGYQQRMIKSIENFNTDNLDRTYNEALSIYPIDMVTEHVIIPILKTLGERWDSREAGIAEEHFFSAFLRNKLGARLHHESTRTKGSKILVSCLPGEHHELGLLLFSIAALGHGYQILYLGTNMPVEQLPIVAERTQVAALLISATSVDSWTDDLTSKLKQCINTVNIPVVFGGRFSDVYSDQLHHLGGQCLGSDHVRAIDKMQSIIPPFIKQ